MSEIKKAVDAVKKHARTMQAYIDLANAIEGIGSIEQAERDANRRKDEAYKIADKAVEAKNKAILELKDLEERIRERNKICDGLIDEAEKKAQSIIDRAETDYVGKMKKVESEKKIVASQIADAQEELRSVHREIATKRKEYEGLEKKFSDLKRKLEGILK